MEKTLLLTLLLFSLISLDLYARVIDNYKEIIVKVPVGKSDFSYVLNANQLLLLRTEEYEIWILKSTEEISLTSLKSTNVIWWHYNKFYEGDPREFYISKKKKPPQKNNIQYHHEIMNSQYAWENFKCDNEIIVALTDDGFRLTHEDLESTWWRNPGEIPDNGIDDDQNGYIDDHLGWNFNENNNVARCRGCIYILYIHIYIY